MEHNWENYFDISSEYWKKVEKIYEDSEHFPKKVVKDRNLHHKFPRSFSKKDGAEIDNDEDNLVSLSLADHFRVHYYLWKCAKKGYRGMMAKAFVFMRKKMVKYASDETIEQLAKDYEAAMKEAAEAHSKVMKGENNPMYGKHHSEESRKKMSELQKGHTAWNKGKQLSAETRKKISEGNKVKRTGKDNQNYGNHLSAETRKKISEAMKGKHTGENNPMYGKHHTDEVKERMSKSLSEAWDYDKHFTEEVKRKMSKAMKGMRWFNNGEKCVRAKECPPGFVPGRIK